MSIFSDIGKAINKAATDVKREVDRTASSIVRHTVEVVQDPMKAVTAIPGVALNAALWAPHLAVQAVGHTVEVVGDITHNADIKAVGQVIHQTDTAIVKGAIKDPIGAASIIGGTALIATGLGGPAGAALVASGTAKVLGSAAREVVPEPPPVASQTALVGLPVPVRPPAAIAPAVPKKEDPTPTRVEDSLWARLVAFIRSLLSHLSHPIPQPA
jgi:hypothetical protein